MSHFPTLPTLIVSISFAVPWCYWGCINLVWERGLCEKGCPLNLDLGGRPLPPGSPLLSVYVFLPVPFIPKEGLPCLNDVEAWAVCVCKVVTKVFILPIRVSNCCCCFFNCLVNSSLWVEGMVAAAAFGFPLEFYFPTLFSSSTFLHSSRKVI